MRQGRKQSDHYVTHQNSSQSSRILDLLYPIVAYFVCCQIVNLLIGILPMGGSIDAVKRQGIGSLLGLVGLYFGFAQPKAKELSGEEHIFGKSVTRKTFTGMLAGICMLGCAGVGVNNLFALTELKQLSDSYQNVEQAFYSSSLGWELLALGVITPVAEELLYRYILYYKLRRWQGITTAIIGSALIFGLIHMNIVQTLYAFILGLGLGILMEYYGDVRVAMLGHMTANILSLLRGETTLFSWLLPGQPAFLPVTCFLLLAAVALAIWHVRGFKKR